MFVQQDLVTNGMGGGVVGERLRECHFDPGLMRPYIETDPNSPLRGRPCANMQVGMKFNNQTGEYHPHVRKFAISDLQARGINSPVFNATFLRKEEWIRLDQRMIEVARPRLRAWGDLEAACPYGGFDGMSKTILEHETVNDPGEAIQDMDGMSEGRTDRPKFQLEGLPLPITHSDFFFSERDLAVSRNSGTPLNMRMAEFASRRVAEVIEKNTIGVVDGIAYGGTGALTGGGAYSRSASVKGYINFSPRLTKIDLTVPTGANPDATVADVLEMRQQLYNANHFGPYMLYHSTDYDTYLDNDYAFASGTGVTAPTKTLRNRLREIDGIQDVRRLDYLTPALSHAFTMIMVELQPTTCQAVNGMSLTTLQWEAKGGMQKMFKVMVIQAPRLFADYDGNCGVLHARTA